MFCWTSYTGLFCRTVVVKDNWSLKVWDKLQWSGNGWNTWRVCVCACICVLGNIVAHWTQPGSSWVIQRQTINRRRERLGHARGRLGWQLLHPWFIWLNLTISAGGGRDPVNWCPEVWPTHTHFTISNPIQKLKMLLDKTLPLTKKRQTQIAYCCDR